LCSRLQSVNTTAGASDGIQTADLCVLHAHAMTATNRIAKATRMLTNARKLNNVGAEDAKHVTARQAVCSCGTPIK